MPQGPDGVEARGEDLVRALEYLRTSYKAHNVGWMPEETWMLLTPLLQALVIRETVAAVCAVLDQVVSLGKALRKAGE